MIDSKGLYLWKPPIGTPPEVIAKAVVNWEKAAKPKLELFYRDAKGRIRHWPPRVLEVKE